MRATEKSTEDLVAAAQFFIDHKFYKKQISHCGIHLTPDIKSALQRARGPSL